MRVAVVTLAIAAAVSAAPKATVREFRADVPMRDGVRLATNVFLPPGYSRLPVILERTPYGKATSASPQYSDFIKRGYAVVVQDVRGRYESEGYFNPLHQEINDGDDTLKWIARQPWCDGKIGMIGGSYRGIVQWKAALANNPALKAIFPVVSGSDDYRDRFYSPGGALKLGNRLLWMSENLKAPGYVPDFSKFVLHLPLRTSDFAATGWPSEMYREALAHPTYDSFWRSISVKEHADRVHVPAFAVGGWYDNFAPSDLEVFEALRKTSGSNRLVIGPWAHSMSYQFADADFGGASSIPIRRMQLEWFDHWLKGKDASFLSDPPLQVFVMGANKWRSEYEWPPREAQVHSFYLESKGHANTLDGDGLLTEQPARQSDPDRFTYDPKDPVPTRGGAVCCNPTVFPWGPLDQRGVERRKDVLVYTTAPMRQDLEVLGPVQVELFVSTSAKDTDFTAKLIDVAPDGYARNLTDGILRLRYRTSLAKPEPAIPGAVYRITVDAGVTGNVFLKGHRLRIEISSSNFPRFDRNANTGGAIASETKLHKANQAIYHDREHPSRVILMVMPVVRQSLPTSAQVHAARDRGSRPVGQGFAPTR